MALGVYLITTIFAAAIIIFKIWYKMSTGRCSSKRKMNGKTIIITGANSGIGKATAVDLAKRGAKLILACRNSQEGLKTAENITQKTGNKDVFFKHLDLSKQSSIRAFAEEINREETRLDVLINNAAISGMKTKKLTEDGIELTFAVNYLGPFLLTHLLLDKLKTSAPSRIIHVSSCLHHYGKLVFEDIENSRHSIVGAYNNSKLALNIFSQHLAEKLVDTGVTSNSLHPGVVNTNIFRRFPKHILWIFKWMLLYIYKDVKEGAQTSIYLAVSEEVDDITGKYFADCKLSSQHAMCADKTAAIKLWKISEKLTQQNNTQSLIN